MKNLIRFLIWGWFAANVQAEPLGIVGSSWPPYIDKSHQSKGMAMEIVTVALQSRGYQTRTSIETWSRALEGVEIGVYDLVAAIWKTPEREKNLLFSQPYLVNQIKFIKMKDTEVEYRTLDDLKGFLIGTVRNYAYDEGFLETQDLIKIPQNHIIQNLLKLTQGKIDLTLGDEKAIRYEIHQYMKGNELQFEFLSKPLSKRNLRIAVSKNHPAAKKIVDDFNQAISKMKGDGTLTKIIKKHQF